MLVFRYFRAVLWGFFGIRRGAGAQQEIGRLSPVALALTGLATAALLVGALMTLARWLAGSIAA
jgi:hypothetical protein